MEIFQTERLVVRQYTASDFENFFLLNGDEEVVRYIRAVQTREEALTSFQQLLNDYEKQPALGRWAAHLKSTGEFVGSFAIIPVPWDLEKIQMGYAFPKTSWGKGYATELTRAGLQHYWQNFENDVVYGMTEIPNVASQKVLLKAGFQLESTTMDKDIELLVYACRRNLQEGSYGV